MHSTAKIIPFNIKTQAEPLELKPITTTEDRNVSKEINTYFNRFEAINTAMTYKRAVADFITETRGKRLDELVESDLHFTMMEVEEYQTALRTKLKASTVNTKMTAIKKFFDKMESYGLDVNAKAFVFDRYTQYDSEKYDSMSVEEVMKSIEIVSNTVKGSEKALFIKVAFATAFRKESMQNLKWSDIYNENGQWVIKTLGKGNKWDIKKISDGLYFELMTFKNTVEQREKIFILSRKTIDKMMKLLREKIDFGNRNIKFHSFKKSSIEEVARITDYDLKAMQAQGNHANITTTLNTYMSDKKLDDMVLVDIDYQLPVDKFDEMSREELLELIKESDRNTQFKLLNKIED